MKSKKIAICVLATNGFSQPKLWNCFLKGSSDKFNVYMHNKNLDANLTELEKTFLISNTVETEWGDISLVSASLEIFREALKNQENQYFILVSGDCIPANDKEYIYSYYMSSCRSSLQCRAFNEKLAKRFNCISDKELFKIENFQKHSQWVGLNREAAQFFIKNDYTHKFTNCLAPDEYYFGTIMKTLGIDFEIKDAMHLTFPDIHVKKWDGVKGGNPNAHPIIFSEENPIKEDSFLDLKAPFFRKIGTEKYYNLPNYVYKKCC